MRAPPRSSPTADAAPRPTLAAPSRSRGVEPRRSDPPMALPSCSPSAARGVWAVKSFPARRKSQYARRANEIGSAPDFFFLSRLRLMIRIRGRQLYATFAWADFGGAVHG